MLGVAISYVGGVFGQALIALDRQRSLFMFGALLVLPLNLGANLALIPLLGTYGAALAYVVTELISVGLLMVVYRRAAKVPRPHRPLRVAAAACAMAAVVLIRLVPGVDGASPVAVLGLGAAVGGTLYVGALYLLRAMPREIHANLVVPVWTRLRPAGRAARS
jgi:O-antigen/teichoic acid export membrane protein